ncbi:FAD dependent oxidoreductase-domain-containing protein [Aspergillus pseudoustus]|uniref:FAD dependent oxidoreductase-domain-containing protein n=1 Tax=Aspergillus pseudoustus TaxID=1810923 RepID=A0ABR4IY64_9EURO
MAFVQSLILNPGIPARDRQRALDRAFADPGLPTQNPTSSFWLRSPHPDLAEAQSTELPSEAEVVIIGSGVTGTSIARTLLNSRKPPRDTPNRPAVVILEARDVCSGATGRNGGHILETAEEFADLEEKHGLEAATKIMRFRMAHLSEMLAVAEEYGITEESQARKVQFLSVYFDEEGWSDAKRRVERLKECLTEESREWKLLEGTEIPRELSLPHAQGIVAGPAGAIWPYRFVTGILAHLKQEFPRELVIETNSPVTEITENSGARARHSLRYLVQTSRGSVRARHVIHCTNAHASHLIPGLRGRIYPIRGQMSAQYPGNEFPCQGGKHSWIFNYERGFDYLTQLPQSDTGKMMMLGGGFAQGEQGGLADIGVASDSELSLYADIHLSGALSAVFGRENWGAAPRPSVERMWTGNMGFSADGFPWVGRLPESLTQRENGQGLKGAEWISAAFSGEGMVHAWCCGKAVATMLLREDGELAESVAKVLDLLPEQMLVTEQRVKRAVLPRSVEAQQPHL